LPRLTTARRAESTAVARVGSWEAGLSRLAVFLFSSLASAFADSGEAARAIRHDAARDSGMMSPGRDGLLASGFLALRCGERQGVRRIGCWSRGEPAAAIGDIPLFDRRTTIPSSRPCFVGAAAGSAGQGWPQATA